MEYPKNYDLADRTFDFARNTRTFLRKIPTDIIHNQDIKQLTRSSGSVGANYIEANESFSRKDFFYRIKICKKEAKESAYWLKLLKIHPSTKLDEERIVLYNEASELVRIFSKIDQRNKQ